MTLALDPKVAVNLFAIFMNVYEDVHLSHSSGKMHKLHLEVHLYTFFFYAIVYFLVYH